MPTLRYDLYEVMDRASVVMDQFVEYVKDMPATQKDPVLREQAEKTEDALMDMYQLAAGVWHKWREEHDR